MHEFNFHVSTRTKLRKDINIENIRTFTVMGSGLGKKYISLPLIAEHLEWLIKSLRQRNEVIKNFRFTFVFASSLKQKYSKTLDNIRFKNFLYFDTLVTFYMSVNNLRSRQKKLLWLSLESLRNLREIKIRQFTSGAAISPYLREGMKLSLNKLDFWFASHSMDFIYLFKYISCWDIKTIQTTHRTYSVWKRTEVKQILAYFLKNHKVTGAACFVVSYILNDNEKYNFLARVSSGNI